MCVCACNVWRIRTVVRFPDSNHSNINLEGGHTPAELKDDMVSCWLASSCFLSPKQDAITEQAALNVRRKICPSTDWQRLPSLHRGLRPPDACHYHSANQIAWEETSPFLRGWLLEQQQPSRCYVDSSNAQQDL